MHETIDISVLGDTTLVARIAAGDHDALAELYDRHGDAAWSVASWVLGESPTCREVVQDVFVEVWRCADTYDPDLAAVATWISRIARARAIDRLRRERAARRDERMRVSLTPEVAAMQRSGDDVEQQAWEVERAVIVRDALDSLPPAQRELVQLAFLEGHTHVELAAMLGLPVGTVKTRIMRGLERLRTALADHAPEVQS